MRLNSLWFAASLVALAAGFVPSINRASADGGGGGIPPCVPAGGSKEYCFERPALGGAGTPTGAQWEDGDGNPVVKEDDTFSDDNMGDASGSDPACTTISNSGGDLSGTSGGTQNGFGEGDCIEVKICWRYLYPATFGSTINGSVEAGSKDEGASATFGAGQTITVVRWFRAYICSGTVEVCPC